LGTRRRERQIEGIERAKARGVYKGRKVKADASEIRRLRHEEGMRPTEIAGRLGISRTTVWRALREDDHHPT